jgi:hypothetical protein
MRALMRVVPFSLTISPQCCEISTQIAWKIITRRGCLDDQFPARWWLVSVLQPGISHYLNLSPSSHLPDITIITPVFDKRSRDIIFFTASRGHHADIGGILPGSMPPTSVNIFEEGAEIMSFKIVNGGIFDRKGLVEYMIDKPSQYPGSSGCRNIKDVESDLKAV